MWKKSEQVINTSKMPTKRTWAVLESTSVSAHFACICACARAYARKYVRVCVRTRACLCACVCLCVLVCARVIVLSVVCCLLSVVCCLLSIVHCPVSVVPADNHEVFTVQRSRYVAMHVWMVECSALGELRHVVRVRLWACACEYVVRLSTCECVCADSQCALFVGMYANVYVRVCACACQYAWSTLLIREVAPAF
jgi:hypothetical protein